MFARSQFIRLFISVFLLLIFSVSVAEAYPQAKKKSYRKAFKSVTRHDEVYQREDFYASMTWHASHLSSDFLAAQVEEVARIYDWSPSEKEKYASTQQTKFSNYTVFFVSFYAYDYKTSDLSDNDSIWSLKLEVGGQRYEPVKFEAVSRPTPLDIQLYPYINSWSRHYFVFYPKFTSDERGDLILKISGPHAQDSLSW